jgi:DNA-directed RNA polymerase
MFRVIREQFVAMYEHHDPIAEFYAKYPGLPKPPAKGSLDIREVLTSQFFFS